jgi:hypothetical protein
VDLPLPAWVMYGFDVIPDAAQRINHSLAPAQPVAPGATLAQGAYVANMCIGCHGEGLSGGRIPGGPPDWPAAANLTPGEGSAMTRYKDEAAFSAMMRSGKRPDGSSIQVMPLRIPVEAGCGGSARLVCLPENPAPAPRGRPLRTR